MPHQLLQEFDQLQQQLQKVAALHSDAHELASLEEQTARWHQKLASLLARGSLTGDVLNLSEHELDSNCVSKDSKAAEDPELRIELVRERALLRAMIDLIPVNIFAKDTQGRFLAANVRVARGMGATPEQLLGKSDFDFFPTDMAQAFFDNEQTVIKSGQALIDHEEVVLDKVTGDMLTFLTSKVPFYDRTGKTIGTVGIGRDITEQRESERKQNELQQQLVNEVLQREHMAIELRLAQKLESVGRLASGVAHEINTPIQFVNDSMYFLQSAFNDISVLLSSCRNALNDLKSGASVETCLQTIEAATATADLEFLKAEIPGAFERTFDGINRVARIVRAMKEFAHADITEHSPADINHALETTLTIALNEYKYHAKVTTEFGEVPEVVCNIGELNQVFLNLIVNAAHAIHDADRDISDGVISISTATVGENVEITIGDNGCGIPQENLDKIYDPFFTTKEVGRGTGQGLAITRSIVHDKHGGTIRVASTVGEGTRFTICLPIIGRADDITEAA